MSKMVFQNITTEQTPQSATSSQTPRNVGSIGSLNHAFSFNNGSHIYYTLMTSTSPIISHLTLSSATMSSSSILSVSENVLSLLLAPAEAAAQLAVLSSSHDSSLFPSDEVPGYFFRYSGKNRPLLMFFLSQVARKCGYLSDPLHLSCQKFWRNAFWKEMGQMLS